MKQAQLTKRTILLFLASLFLHADAHTQKRALIIGVTGQDGAYLAELLLNKGYQVHGIKRRSSSFNTARIDHLYKDLHLDTANNFILHYGDVTDATQMIRTITEILPDEIYNLSAQSHVHVSFQLPVYTAQVDGIGVLNILEAIRILMPRKKIKFYQASTSELYGQVQEIPQTERTAFYPRSPYGVAKLYGFWITKNYRESYDIFACNGILFNHESPRRGETFVTRKITRAVAHIACGKQDILYLGNLDAQRDWGHARDYVEAMWLMLQQDAPDDYVVATGEMHSVREFVEKSFQEVGITVTWHSTGIHEYGVNAATGVTIVMIDPKYFRPAEVELLVGDAHKAHTALCWQPRVPFDALIKEMVTHDLNLIKKGIENS